MSTMLIRVLGRDLHFAVQSPPPPSIAPLRFMHADLFLCGDDDDDVSLGGRPR